MTSSTSITLLSGSHHQSDKQVTFSLLIYCQGLVENTEISITWGNASSEQLNNGSGERKEKPNHGRNSTDSHSPWTLALGVNGSVIINPVASGKSF
ncbi:hypothetical protein MHYP_G00295770 [Metynnis hypsauchen]